MTIASIRSDLCSPPPSPPRAQELQKSPGGIGLNIADIFLTVRHSCKQVVSVGMVFSVTVTFSRNFDINEALITVGSESSLSRWHKKRMSRIMANTVLFETWNSYETLFPVAVLVRRRASARKECCLRSSVVLGMICGNIETRDSLPVFLTFSPTRSWSTNSLLVLVYACCTWWVGCRLVPETQ